MTESAAKRPPQPLYYIDDERFTRFMRLEVWNCSSPVPPGPLERSCLSRSRLAPLSDSCRRIEPGPSR